MRIRLLIPILGGARAGFTVCLANLVSHTVLETRAEVTAHTVSISSLTVARNTLLDMALKRGADHVLWLDSDHTFPSDALLRLLAHGKEAVAANYPRREMPITATAARDGRLVEPKAEGLEEVDSAGLGLFLLDMAVMAKLQRHADETGQPLWPLFKEEWSEGPAVTGEDRYFCSRLKAAGIPIHIDHNLSNEVGHIAETVLRFPR